MRVSDTVGRIGGDEFAIVRSNLAASAERARRQQIVAALMRPFDVDGHETWMSASVGIALPARRSRPADLLLKRRRRDVPREGARPQQLPVLHDRR